MGIVCSGKNETRGVFVRHITRFTVRLNGCLVWFLPGCRKC